MTPSRDFRDPVHGFVHLEGRECDVVDTPIFQRLRRIKQLALAHLVYPGAVHTRFEHTLGVVHVAGRMADRLKIGTEQKRIIRLAALLHDIGHGPFSHPSEDVLSSVAAATGNLPKGATDKIHEVITRDIIRTDKNLTKLISDTDREDIIKLLDTGWGEPLFKDIVSGPLDADKQDYLLRDSHHCGVRYGVYDINRLHEVFCRVKDVSGDGLAVEEDAVNTLEQFVLARYYLMTQVISHKIRRITDAMLVRGLTLGVNVDKIPFLVNLYTYRPGPEFVDQYVLWNDERLVTSLLEADYTDTWAGKCFRRLAERRLPKIVFRRSLDAFPGLRLSVQDIKDAGTAIETQVAGILGVSPNEVIFRRQKSPETRKSEASVMVNSTTGRPQSFEDCSAIFRSIEKSLKDEHFECYAPLDGKDEWSRKAALAEIDAVVSKHLTDLNIQPKLFGEGHGS